MQSKQPISIVVPTLNEADNVPALLARIDVALGGAKIPYEVIIVDDHSTDGTIEITRTMIDKYPVALHLKRGKRGKAYSLLEGFELANHDLIAMIDADLQYPPEDLVAMHQLMNVTNADVVVTNRHQEGVSALRKLSTKVFNLLFAKLLFGIDFDTQSGLKLFKKQVMDSFTMNPSPWTFDLEFLVRALENKYTIVSHDIIFSERKHGVTKIKLLSATLEMSKASLRLRWRTSASQIRAGYQANDQFLKKAMQVIVLAGLLATFTPFSHSSAQALGLSLPQTVSLPQAQSTLAVTISLPTLPGSGSAGGTTTPTPPSTGTGSGTGITTGSGSAPTTSSGTTGSSTATPQTTANSGTPASPATITSANPSTSNASLISSAAAPDQSGLGAATANKKGGLYASTYPNSKLSRQINDRLVAASRVAVLTSIACLFAAIILSGMRSRRMAETKPLTRS